MRISFSPQRCDNSLTVEKTGDRLRINGEIFNFNPLPEGGTIKASDIPCDWIVGDVSRIGGEIELTLLLPHGASPPSSVAFALPLEGVMDGIVRLPSDPKRSVPLIQKPEVANVDA
jgi:hypothetical protein